MDKAILDTGTLGAFCDSVSTMLAAGIQTDEAVSMLAEDAHDSALGALYQEVYHGLMAGKGLAGAMEATGAFPAFCVSMVATGESSGRTEQVLRELASSYDSEAVLFERLRATVGYPAAMLCLMTVILAFTVFAVLPIFVGVYENLTGSLTEGSFGQVAVAMVVGWVALALCAVFAGLSLWCVVQARSPKGQARLMGFLRRLPATRDALYGLAFSRFASSLSVTVASGTNVDDAMADALATVDDPVLAEKLSRAHDLMVDGTDPHGLVQALGEVDILDPLYLRLLGASARTGGVDNALNQLSRALFQESEESLSGAVDAVEPVLSAFLTVAVGATLIAVMLPLVGIMGTIG